MKLSRLVLAASLVAVTATPLFAGPLPGAIFTTVQDGSRVNANLYADKRDVYLDGGPGPNAPASAAALPEGDYYFQVTDPSGKKLLSTDAVQFRRFRVSAAGVITRTFNHATGVDRDHPELGAKTVQLYPYLDTPNNGGVYKVWVTPVGKFAGDMSKVDNPIAYHGFYPSWSKMDTFKVRSTTVTCTPSTVTIRKFEDSNANGQWDDGEGEISGWQMYVTDPSGTTKEYLTPAVIDTAAAGMWLIVEDTTDSRPIVAVLDGQVASGTPYVLPQVRLRVTRECGETHTVIFGNNFCHCP